MTRIALMMLAILGTGLSGCTEMMVGSHFFKKASASNTCVSEGAIKVGSPYLVDGVRYAPMKSSLDYSEKGIASWYGSDFHGKSSANGECYNMYAFTAAHKTLPLPTVVRVTNLENGKSIVVKVNDRGPYVRGRIIDLSYAAAQSLGVVRTGTAPVLVEAIGGPHHLAGGYKGGPTRLARTFGPRDAVAETLPTVMPGTMEDEALAPLPKPIENALPDDVKAAKAKFRARQAAMVAQANAVPTPDTSLPKPPAFEKQVLTDTAPLTHARVYVQLGAYRDEARATAQKSKALPLYKTTDLSVLSQRNTGNLYRVRVGAFPTIADAEAALDALVKNGFDDARIVVEGGETTPDNTATRLRRRH